MSVHSPIVVAGSRLTSAQRDAYKLDLAKALIGNFLAAVEAEHPDTREAFMNYAVARARHELADGGRLA